MSPRVPPNTFRRLLCVLLIPASGALGPARADDGKEREALRKQVDAGLRAVQAALANLPRESFDPSAVIDRVGREPEALFRFVRNETILVPYRGTLRRGSGVLMDGVGSSLDRALLLAELLAAAGAKARLARAPLDDAEARRLFEAWSGADPRRPTERTAVTDALAGFEAHGIDVARVRESLKKAQTEAARIETEVARRKAAQRQAITAALKDARAMTARDPAADVDAALEALRDHWWVQYERGDGTWRDLDPSQPSAEPGQTFAKAAATFLDPGAEHLPPGLRHEVEIRVIIERWEGEHLIESPILAHTLEPADVLGKRLALGHYAPQWPTDLELRADAEGSARLRAAVLAQHEWVPVLVVGEKTVAVAGFTDEGTPKEIGAFISFDPAASRVKNMLGGGRRAASCLTAEWIEYEIRSPGRPAYRVRREIFDLVGPSARRSGKTPQPAIGEKESLDRGLALFGTTEVLLLPCTPAAEYVAHLAGSNLLANRAVLEGLIGAAGDVTTNLASLGDRAEAVAPLPSGPYYLAAARALLGPLGGRAYLDRPNILTQHGRLRIEGAGEGGCGGEDRGGTIVLCSSFDIVANEVAVRSAPGVDPFALRLEQGIVDTNAEALLATGCGKAENTGEMFAAASNSAGATGGHWVLLRSSSDAAWDKVKLGPDVRARIEAALAEGNVALVPSEPVSCGGRPVVGWWRVDPGTGNALGIGGRGWGQSATELFVMKARVVLKVVGGALCFYFVMSSSMPDRAMGPLAVICIVAGGTSMASVLIGGPSASAGAVLALGADVLAVLAAGIIKLTMT